MIQELSYQEKLALIREWIPDVICEIKKEIRNEHLRGNYLFMKRYLGGKPLAKISTEELVAAYEKAISEDLEKEQIATFIVQRWLAKQTDVYAFFAEELGKVDPDFASLESIDDAIEKKIVANAVDQFGARNSYLFSILNSVVFSQQAYDSLKTQALEQREQQLANATASRHATPPQELKAHYEEQIARLTDNYEKKLNGWQKKYFHDIDALKKQIASLQRRLHASS